MSHFDTLVGLGIALVLSSAQAAETTGGGSSATTLDGGRPTIRYLSPPTKSLPTTPTKPRGEELKKILDALGMMMAPKNTATGATGLEPYPGYSEFGRTSSGEPADPSMGAARPGGATDISGPYPIIAPFQKYFDGCISRVGLGHCSFVNLGIMGDEAHRRRRSCHNVGEAIDVGPLSCSGGSRTGTIDPVDPEFYELAKCMAHETNNELETIFYRAEGPNMIQKSDHDFEVHIQLKNCRMVTGQ